MFLRDFFGNTKLWMFSKILLENRRVGYFLIYFCRELCIRNFYISVWKIFLRRYLLNVLLLISEW